MKLIWVNLLLLLAISSTVSASSVEGSFQDARLCNDKVLTVTCSFDADPNRRRQQRNLRALGGSGKNQVEDVFDKCTIDGFDQDARINPKLFAEPMEDLLVTLNDDEHGDKTKVHIFMTKLTARTTDSDESIGTSLLVKLEVTEYEDPNDETKTITAYSDIDIQWSC